MFIDDFEIKVHNYGDADNFALITIEDSREEAPNKLPQKSIPIEHATPELIGKAIADYITEYLTDTDEPVEQPEDESKGYAISFYPWDDDMGRPRIAGRFHTKAEKDQFLDEINSEGSGWLEEELATITVHNDYNFMLPL